jgi:hypothetical protein
VIRKTLRTLMLFSIGAAGTLLLAQYGPPQGPYGPGAVNSLVDRVHEDLNHGYSAWNLHGDDRDRLNHAEHDLRNFSHNYDHGKFDKGDLDHAIEAIQHVLDRNQLSGPERDKLSADLDQLRQLREAYDRHEVGNWEYR